MSPKKIHHSIQKQNYVISYVYAPHWEYQECPYPPVPVSLSQDETPTKRLLHRNLAIQCTSPEPDIPVEAFSQIESTLLFKIITDFDQMLL